MSAGGKPQAKCSACIKIAKCLACILVAFWRPMIDLLHNYRHQRKDKVVVGAPTLGKGSVFSTVKHF